MERIHPKHQRLTAALLITLACVAIAWTLARFATAWLEQARTGPGLAAGGAGGSAAPLSAPPLSEQPLFGAPPALAGESAASDAPESTLALTLRGTLSAPEPAQALAIIADADGGERTYRVGAELPGGATLERVHRDRALIRYQGRLETLPLRQRESGASGSPHRYAGLRRDSAAAKALSSAELQRMQRALLADPSSLAAQVNLQPVHEGGEIVGMRLQPGVGAAVMSQFGIRATDVITDVNGLSLDREMAAEEVLRHLKGAEQLQVTLLRNGRREQLTVPLGR